MKVGVGKYALAFPKSFFPTEGFVRQIDQLHVRVMLLEAEIRVAILSVEMTSLPQEEVKALQETLKAVFGEAECFVCVTHTFSAPHLLPDFMLIDETMRQKKAAFQHLLRNAVSEAAQEAFHHLAEARFALGTAECMVNTPRDIETQNGWWIDACGVGLVDHRLTALCVTDVHDRVYALLLHYPVQSSVLEGSQLRDGGKAVSCDLAGELCRGIEARYPGAVALYLVGAAGDQAPEDKALRCVADASGRMSITDKQDDAIALLHMLGERMTNAAFAAAQSARFMCTDTLSVSRAQVVLPCKEMERNLHKLCPTRIVPYQPSGNTTQTIEMLTIGDLRLICVKPELCCVTSLSIGVDNPNVRIASMVNGSAKYMADQASYDRITYEAMNSPFGKGAAERLSEAIKCMLIQSSPDSASCERTFDHNFNT